MKNLEKENNKYRLSKLSALCFFDTKDFFDINGMNGRFK